MLGGAEEILGGGLGGDNDLVAGVDLDLLVVLQQTGADLGALGVEQDAHGQAELLGDAADAVDAALVLLVGTVGEVEAGNVHASLDHLADLVVAVARGTHGADDLGALVHSLPPVIDVLPFSPINICAIIRTMAQGARNR